MGTVSKLLRLDVSLPAPPSSLDWSLRWRSFFRSCIELQRRRHDAMLILSLTAMSFSLLAGYGGLLSLAQALFRGLTAHDLAIACCAMAGRLSTPSDSPFR